jgi:hypothetical protein
MTIDTFLWSYTLVGFVYWCINMYVRKLPSKNEDGDGWVLSPLWLFGWPLCFIALAAAWISDKISKKF